MATSPTDLLAVLAQRTRAFEFLYDALVVTDLDGVVVDWSAGATKLYGYERDEIVGQPVSILHAPEDVDRITAEVFAGIARDGFWTGEIKRREKSGKTGWIESMVIPLLDDGGAPKGALGVNRDITRRKEFEEALRSSETRWRSLLESLPDAVVISDHEGRIVIVNARAETLLGYEREALIGQSVDLLLPDALRARHVEHRAGFVSQARSRPMGSGRILQARRSDGNLVPVEIGLAAIETPGGTWFVAIVHDVSAREAMNEQLALLGAALGAAANGIAISDAKGICQWINPGFTAITGYRPEEIVGHKFSILRSGAHDAAFFRDLWTTITAGRSWHGEITNRHRDGHCYIEEQTIAPVRSASGAITHFIAIKQDITKRREMENQLRTANETLTRHVAEIEVLHAQLREQAIRDPLTGLYNRRYLTETLERELSRAARTNEPVAVAIIDVDHFKAINDTYGHRAGDRVLEALGAVLRNGTRRSDVVCRHGGEEFTILMPGATARVAAQRAEALRAHVAESETPHEGGRIRLTLSIGVAAFPECPDGDALLRAADEALYAAKDAGRNRVVVRSRSSQSPAPGDGHKSNDSRR